MLDQNSRMPEFGRSGKLIVGGGIRDDEDFVSGYGLSGSALRCGVREIVDAVLDGLDANALDPVGEASRTEVGDADLSEGDLECAGVASDVTLEEDVTVEEVRPVRVPLGVADLTPVSEVRVRVLAMRCVAEDVVAKEVLVVLAVVRVGVGRCAEGDGSGEAIKAVNVWVEWILFPAVKNGCLVVRGDASDALAVVDVGVEVEELVSFTAVPGEEVGDGLRAKGARGTRNCRSRSANTRSVVPALSARSGH